MCGIAGLSWNSPDRLPRIAEVRRMVNVLAHRGPDDSGLYHSQIGLLNRDDGSDASMSDLASSQSPPSQPSASQPGAMLGHRRLSIIDLAGGRQPLSNEDGSVWIVLNGEIYNYRELRSDLRSRGHRFSTESDTEVIVHLYEDYGDDCVLHLRGMFAFVIWDQRRTRLLLARDRLGQKPLIYRHHAGRVDFASELKGLLQLDDAAREIDPIAIDQYLTYQYVPHTSSILKGYAKLPPAHLATFEDGKLSLRRYWRPPYEPGVEAAAEVRSDEKTRTEVEIELRDTLTEAVRLRMRSDVPLGAFLSGGIDSTIITGLMQELSEQPVHTFSIGFPVAKFDERTFAREAAEHLGTIHHEKVVEPSALSILPKLIWHYDEPLSDSSAIPMMYLSEMTREFVTVALSGDGADELFAGYDRYRAVRLAAAFDRLPRPLRAVFASRLWQRIPASVQQKSFRRRLKRFLDALGEEPQRSYLNWINIFDQSRRRGIYSDRMIEQLGDADAASFLQSAYTECPSRDFVTQTTCADVLTYLPCDILTKVDIASMAYGLECRSPFLDHRVAELAAWMPLKYKRHGKQGKQILLDTFGDLLPASIQNRPKMGFGVPLDSWFRNELKPLLFDVLLDRKSLDRGWFRPDAVQQLVDEHVTAKWDHSYRLWNLLILELWQQTFLDSTSVPVGPVSL
ncbi:MAG: asparagine synthase (glutamine-hydrolyzing) [Rhodopirellula sp.]|nr:asparagine synthase (glutamine-hydrolyzing) [Rhodopirellula sp.]